MTSLNIAHNKLQSKRVQGGAFRESRALQCIDLQDNDLHRVPSLPKTITELNLSGKFITVWSAPRSIHPSLTCQQNRLVSFSWERRLLGVCVCFWRFWDWTIPGSNGNWIKTEFIRQIPFLLVSILTKFRFPQVQTVPEFTSQTVDTKFFFSN